MTIPFYCVLSSFFLLCPVVAANGPCDVEAFRRRRSNPEAAGILTRLIGKKKSFLRMFQDVNVLELIGRRIRNISKQWAILSLILNPLWRQTFGLGEPQSSDLHRMFFCFLPHAQRLAISKTNITAIPVSMLYSCCISRPNHFDAPQHL